MSSPERIQKLLARAGYGSRREVERWVEQGLITINGEVARLGAQASVDDKITLRGELLALGAVAKFRPRVIAYHKPLGEVVSRKDPEGRSTVFDNLPRMQTSRWIAVGRLDVNTSGLLLFTNDGELAAKLMHPSSEIEREYAVRVLGEVDSDALKQLRTGVDLEDGMAHFESIAESGGGGANRWYHVMLKEGRNHEVRRLWASQGVTVSRLTRVRFGPVTLPKWLKPGKWQELESKPMSQLYRAVGLQPPSISDRKRRGRRRR